MTAIGNELKRLRELRGLNLEDASKLIGITRQYLSMLEKGQRKSASFEIMNRVSEIYQVPMDYLRKFIGEQAKELSEEELKLWSAINRKAEDEVYYKNSDDLINCIVKDIS